jgi:hypothetical protein
MLCARVSVSNSIQCKPLRTKQVRKLKKCKQTLAYWLKLRMHSSWQIKGRLMGVGGSCEKGHLAFVECGVEVSRNIVQKEEVSQSLDLCIYNKKEH